MRYLIFFALLLILACQTSREFTQVEISQHQKEIMAFRTSQGEKFADPAQSPLGEEKAASFTSLEYFPINLDFKVTGTFTRTPKAGSIQMPTSSEKIKTFHKYGIFSFKYGGKKHELTFLQSVLASRMPSVETTLFVPFTDLTNGESTYGGGRYMDVPIPKGSTYTLDFNKAYNPYCAYSDGWSCPIPPRENDLKIAILAGVKDYHKD